MAFKAKTQADVNIIASLPYDGAYKPLDLDKELPQIIRFVQPPEYDLYDEIDDFLCKYHPRWL